MFDNSDYEGNIIKVEKYDPKHPDLDKIDKIYVTNIPVDASDSDVKTIFEKQGKIKSFKVENDVNNARLGSIVYENYESCNNAIAGDNGSIVVTLDKGNKRKKSLEYSSISNKNSLYFKNISDAVNEKTMRKEFEKFGEID